MQIVETGDLDSAKNSILNVIENFINNGVDNDSKSLGAYYVLASLTLVNSNAAEAIPWLYQSVLYIWEHLGILCMGYRNNIMR